MATKVVLCLCVLWASVEANNYDAYLADLSLRNQETHELFRRHNPSGSFVLDYVLSSPEFRKTHPVLLEYDNEEEIEDSDVDEAWEHLLMSLAFAEDTARNHDVEMATKRFQSSEAPWANWQLQLNRTSPRARAYPAYPGSEFAPQDHNWGTHRVSGGSSEVGSWINYAVYGAQAQEDEDDEEDEGEAVMSPVLAAKSGVKLDQLPAYCDPPNPCPIGYDPATLATPCDRDVEDTKQFNRHWIWQKMRSGECSCDEEHMEACPTDKPQSEDDFEELRENHRPGGIPYLRGRQRTNIAAKKSGRRPAGRHVALGPKEIPNPYFMGNRLRNVVKKSGHPH
uniref:Neuroendocrine protein 7B2 n=1 Tax=Mesocestoides corti TaxID=53468 RepID=A0A5K3ER18_MESCO